MLHRLINTDNGIVFAWGDTVPTDASAKYAPGCVFAHTDGSSNDCTYINEGTVLSCDFNALSSVTSATTFSTTLTIGAFASLLKGSGIAISTTIPHSLVVYGDDAGLSIADSVSNARSRMLLTVDQTGGSIRALQGQLKLATGVDTTSGIYTAIQGYVELVTTHSTKTGATFSCIDASMELGGVCTVDSGGEHYGIHVETTGAGTIVNNGTCAAIGVTIASGAAAWPVGIYVTGGSILGTTGVGLQVGADGSSAGDVVFYGTAASTYVKWDENANSQGRFIVAEASSRLSCSHHDGQNTGLGNECCLAARQSHNCTTTTGQTQGGRAMYAEYTLVTANTNASELSWAGMFAVEGTMVLNGTLNGSMVNAFGVAGELRGAGAQTECRDIAPLAAINNNSINPTTGRKSMIYSDNSSGTVDAVLTHRGSCTALFDFDDASTFVVENNTEWGTKAGHIKVIMPSGNAAYINLYDGSAS